MPARAAREKSGVALVLIIMLLGVVATLTVNVQSSVVLVQRHMQAKRLRIELRTAAADTAWCFLRDRVKRTPASGSLPAPESAVLPSGVETHVNVVDGTSLLMGSVPVPGSKSGSGKVFLLQATAAASNVVELVSCVYRRDKGGTIEVLGWDQESGW